MSLSVGLITYDCPHLKTEQVFNVLSDYYDYDLNFFALPFKDRLSREVKFKHRPSQSASVHPRELAHKHGTFYVACESDTDVGPGCDVYLVLGAGLLSADCLKGKKVINSHPGIIPLVRGLDAFKWAVIGKQPVGNTLHFVSEGVDEGEPISILKTDVYVSDSIETFARRHYEAEISLLCNFERYLSKPRFDCVDVEKGEAKRRMPRDIENNIYFAFDEYLKKFADSSIDKNEDLSKIAHSSQLTAHSSQLTAHIASLRGLLLLSNRDFFEFRHPRVVPFGDSARVFFVWQGGEPL